MGRLQDTISFYKLRTRPHNCSNYPLSFLLEFYESFLYSWASRSAHWLGVALHRWKWQQYCAICFAAQLLLEDAYESLIYPFLPSHLGTFFTSPVIEDFANSIMDFNNGVWFHKLIHAKLSDHVVQILHELSSAGLMMFSIRELKQNKSIIIKNCITIKIESLF